MQLVDQLRSTSFRVGFAYAVLFFLSVMTILGATYLAATSELAGIVRLSVNDDITRFRISFERSGMAGLRQEVAEATKGPADDRFFLLIDGNGEVLAGNLPAPLWMEGSSDRVLSGEIIHGNPSLVAAAANNLDNEIRFFAVGVRLGDLSVMAARNAHTLDETQEVIVSALLWGTIPTTMLALVGGFIVSIGPTRRVDAIAASMREVAQGHLDIRLPISSRKDELDRLSRDINAMLQRIAALMSSLKQVSTDIAHDLRTPLARLRQRLDDMSDEAIASGSNGAAMESAVSDIDSIIETFNALLRIAQIEAGARKAKFVRLDLSALLLQIHEIYESVAEEAGYVLTIDVSGDLDIEGDVDLLQQLVSNLIENALTHATAPGRISIGASRSDEAVLLEIADDGPGIPEEERGKVFRRLYRLDRSRATPGNGLGLALVAAIADLHGAKIRALDNRPGLRMEISFPPAMPIVGAGRDGPTSARERRVIGT